MDVHRHRNQRETSNNQYARKVGVDVVFEEVVVLAEIVSALVDI